MITKDAIIFSPNIEIKNKFLTFIGENENLCHQKESKIEPEISFTSYHQNAYDLRLVKLYYKNLDPYVRIYVDRYFMNCIWYQIYNSNSGSYQDYHTHNGDDCHISGIYYLKLKDNKISTQFIVDGTLTQFDVKEGDIILFNSSIMHRSPPNNTSDDKIILAFNLDCSL